MTEPTLCNGCRKPITFRRDEDNDKWLRFNPDGTPHVHERRGGGGRSAAELRDIRRLSVLKAAAAFGASRPDMKSSDVLTIANRWLAWLERGRA
jgi:hypothetical protein